MNLSTVFVVNEIFGVAFGLLINLVLYLLIQAASPSDLNSYTRLLKLHCLTDLFYTIINGLTSLRVIYIGKQIFLVVLGPFAYWKSFGGPVACALITFAFFSELTFVPIDYYYRYVLVCRNSPFTNLRFALCVLLAGIVTAFYTAVSASSTVYGPPNEIIKYWPAIRKTLNLGKNPVPFGISDPENPRMALTLSAGTIITLTVYTIIGLTTYRIHQTLAENARRQVRRESSHVRQITLVMVVQALLPFFALATPILIVTLFSVLGISVQLVGYLITLSISWTPVLKPLITIYIIRPYRRAIKRKIFGGQAAGADTSVSETQISSSGRKTTQSR